MKTITALGAAHWDLLGRSEKEMAIYDDYPGKVRRMVGGVSGPIAMKLAHLGLDVDLMAYAGKDELGEALINKLELYRVKTEHMARGPYPTDVYMGIEAPNGLIAAIADCHSLEAVSMELVNKLLSQNNSKKIVVIDGNLHPEALSFLSVAGIDAEKLILVPASPGKIDRFLPFSQRKDTEIYVNLREANALCQYDHNTSIDAATALVKIGYLGAIVTNGNEEAAHSGAHGVVFARPPQITVKRFTGAGDTLTAHHIFATTHGDTPQAALEYALHETSKFISTEDRDV